MTKQDARIQQIKILRDMALAMRCYDQEEAAESADRQADKLVRESYKEQALRA